MDFTGYRSDALGAAVDLVNALGGVGVPTPSAGRPPLPALLAHHRYTVEADWGPALDAAFWAWAARLAEVFRAADPHAPEACAAAVNELLVSAAIAPHLTAHDGQPWHLHYTAPGAPVLERIKATTAVALAVLVSDHGATRHGVCAAPSCSRVFADTSRNARRRFCRPGCANRTAVAAHRARRREG